MGSLRRTPSPQHTREVESEPESVGSSGAGRRCGADRLDEGAGDDVRSLLDDGQEYLVEAVRARDPRWDTGARGWTSVPPNDDPLLRLLAAVKQPPQVLGGGSMPALGCPPRGTRRGGRVAQALGGLAATAATVHNHVLQ